MKLSFVVIAALALTGLAAGHVEAQTIVDEWALVKAPPTPELKTLKLEAKETALLMLDFLKQNCPPRPRCVASLPKVQRLLAEARAKGVHVVYSLVGPSTADVLPEVAAREGEPFVSSGPDKFLNTELEKILKDRGVKTVIVAGTAAEGAVLSTGAAAALRGFKVIVPVDGLSSGTQNAQYAEQYTVWHLANAPRVGPQTTVTRSDLIGF